MLRVLSELPQLPQLLGIVTYIFFIVYSQRLLLSDLLCGYIFDIQSKWLLTEC